MDLLLKEISEGLKSISNECYFENHPLGFNWSTLGTES